MEALRERLARLRAADPQLARFGACAHRYELSPPLSAARLRELEQAIGLELPADYSRLLLTADGGAGPGFGLVPFDHPEQLAALGQECPLHGSRDRLDGEEELLGDALLQGTVLLSDRGCGYYDLLVVRGALRGAVVLDLRNAGRGIAVTHRSFAAWYEEWLDEGVRQPGGPAHGACALALALSAYFDAYESAHGVEPGGLSWSEVKTAFDRIDRPIETRNGRADRFFDVGEPMRLCASCEGLRQRLVGRGLVREGLILSGGLPPKPARAHLSR